MRRRRTVIRRSRSGGMAWAVLLTGIAVIGVAGAVWWMSGTPRGDGGALPSGERSGSVPPGEDLSIWFASPQEDALVLEKQRVPPQTSSAERAKTSLQALITGPKAGALRTLSADVSVRELFIDDRGTAYVDFTEALSRDHPGGTWSEMLTLRSILQTLAANVPELKRVQILIEGQTVDTLAGHVDIRRPLSTTWVTN
jgi:spore germination protein GerM